MGGGSSVGGLGEAVTLAGRLAREHGLPDARCTTDVKHIEIGLTDKSDAMAWLAVLGGVTGTPIGALNLALIGSFYHFNRAQEAVPER